MLFIDNDALIKIGLWGLVDKTLELLSEKMSTCRRLESLSHMLRRSKSEYLKFATVEQFDELMRAVSTIPVLDEELDIDVVNRLLEIDGIDAGEAALIAGLVSAKAAELLTGDKKALSAIIEAELDDLIALLTGRCHSIESLIVMLVSRYGFAAVCEHLSTCVAADSTVRICLGHDGDASEADFTLGMVSFLNGFSGRRLLKVDENLQSIG